MCGIAGFLGSTDPNEVDLFSPIIMKYLMLRQDSRGRDNCGIYYRTEHEGEIKERVEWGWKQDEAGSTQTFEEFLAKRELMPFSGPHKIIAHSRRGSVGSSSIDNAHPFVVGDVIGVHNGTVRNWEHLMEHLNVDVTGIECDSEAIFKAISEGHTHDVLAKYQNAATLVWTEKDSNITYLWCGGSSTYINGPLKADRDLHIWETNAGIYISSERDPLVAMQLCMPKDYSIEDPYQIDVNTLYQFRDNELISKVFIDRTPYYKTYGGGKKGKNQRTKNVSQKQSGTIQGGVITDDDDLEIPSGTSTGTERLSSHNFKLDGEGSVPSWFCLTIKNGLYYRGNNPLHSDVRFINPFFQHEVDEFNEHGHFIVTHYYVDENSEFCYWSEYHNSYKFSNPKKSAEAPKGVTELFFYRGLLFKDKDACLQANKVYSDMNKSKYRRTDQELSPYFLLNFVAQPVPRWWGISKEDKKKKTFFIFQPKGGIGDSLKNNKEHMSGWFRYPYTDVYYKFLLGAPVERAEEVGFALNNVDNFTGYAKAVHQRKVDYVFKAPMEGYHGVNCQGCGQFHYLTREEIMLVPECPHCNEEVIVNPSALAEACEC
jgi:hypothetical protein